MLLGGGGAEKEEEGGAERVVRRRYRCRGCNGQQCGFRIRQGWTGFPGKNAPSLKQMIDCPLVQVASGNSDNVG